MSAGKVLKREARVAFSRRAQPIWFRVLKWAIVIALGAIFWRKPYFWWLILGSFGLAVTLHLFWRWKTRGWTRPWGGWNDLEAADKNDIASASSRRDRRQ